MSMQKVLQYKNSWRLLEKTVLIEKAEKMHTYEDPGIYTHIYIHACTEPPNHPNVWANVAYMECLRSFLRSLRGFVVVPGHI